MGVSSPHQRLAEKEFEDLSIYSGNKVAESLCFHHSLKRLKFEGFLLITEMRRLKRLQDLN